MDFNAYEKANITTDVVLFRSIDIKVGDRKGMGKALQVLLVKRTNGPEQGKLALPGGFINIEDKTSMLEETAKQKLLEKTGIQNVYLEQLKTFDSPNRDSRGRVFSVAYLGLTNELSSQTMQLEKDAYWFTICDGYLTCNEKLSISYESEKLAFDHGEIIKEAVNRLKNKIDYTNIVFQLLPEKFTIKEVQLLFESILGYRIDSFRRKLGDRVIELDEIVQRVGKPAKLYAVNKVHIIN